MRTRHWVGVCLCVGWMVGSSPAAMPAKEIYLPSLQIGFTTYSNVTVMDKSGGTVWLRHSGGITSVRVENLDAATLNTLGLQPPPAPAKPSLFQSKPKP